MLRIAAAESWSMREACNQTFYMEVECVQSQSQTVIKYIIKCAIATSVLRA